MKRTSLTALLLALCLTAFACTPKTEIPEPTAMPTATAEPTPTPVPTPTPEPTPYDMTGNGVVDAVDEAALQRMWPSPSAPKAVPGTAATL